MSDYNLFDHYRMMEEQHIVLSFKGEISNKTLVSLAEMIKKMFSAADKKVKVTKKIFSIFIEFAQNIYHYSAKKMFLDGKMTGTGIITIEKNDGFYKVKSGNLVENSAIPKLVKRIEYINNLDKAGLKGFYNEQLKLPRQAGKKGVGVGLIVIARKSGYPIDLKQTRVDENQAFIELSTKICEEEE